MAVEVGQKVSGKVTGITNFGAFISLPENQSGLVHISEISEGFVKDINDILSVGDQVDVMVLKVTPDGKINLSIRKAQDGASEVRKESKPAFQKSNFERREATPQRAAVKPNFQSTPKDNSGSHGKTIDFDQLMSSFLKDSEDRLTSLKRNTEGKRGGRGGRRG